MAKQRKKRTKKYSGAGARVEQPQVVRVEAVKRSKLGQWWFEKKKFTKPALFALAIIFVLSWLLFELLRLVF